MIDENNDMEDMLDLTQERIDRADTVISKINTPPKKKESIKVLSK